MGKQIIRAGLEDHFLRQTFGPAHGGGRLLYQPRPGGSGRAWDTLLTLLGAAGINYVMGVPGADDIMLNYQSTSFHDSHYLRQLLALRPAPEFEAWLERMAVTDGGGRLLPVTAEHHVCWRGK